MKNIDNIINDLIKYETKTKGELRFIYDTSLALFFQIIEDKKSKVKLSDLTKNQSKQLVDWLEKYPLPLYEEIEHYEKCQKIKELIEKIKNLALK